MKKINFGNLITDAVILLCSIGIVLCLMSLFPRVLDPTETLEQLIQSLYNCPNEDVSKLLAKNLSATAPEGVENPTIVESPYAKKLTSLAHRQLDSIVSRDYFDRFLLKYYYNYHLLCAERGCTIEVISIDLLPYKENVRAMLGDFTVRCTNSAGESIEAVIEITVRYDARGRILNYHEIEPLELPESFF